MKINKKTEALLVNIARKMPPTFDIVREKMPVSGPELVHYGITEVQGRPVNLLNTYIKSVPRKVPRDQLTRIRRVFKKRGREGLFEYLKKFVKPEGHGKLREMVNAI